MRNPYARSGPRGFAGRSRLSATAPSRTPLLPLFAQPLGSPPSRARDVARFMLLAQRLAASSSGSPERPTSSTASPGCAQRLAASSSGSRRDVPAVILSHGVLNASRCLRRVRPSGGGRCLREASAQRLAASSSGSPRGRSLQTTALKCSTPRGVVVGFARRIHGCTSPRRVLNASRRRRRGSRTATPPTPEVPAGAQRLAASSSGSPIHLLFHTLSSNVLNASRRRRRVRMLFTAAVRTAGVLNASRRRRRVRSARTRNDAPVAGCSTPRGVVVGFASRSPRPSRQISVLNASRRRRRVRRPLTASIRRHCGAQRLAASSSGSAPRLLHVIDTTNECSTPRGVTDVGSRDSDARVPDGVRCSTPRGVVVGCARIAASPMRIARRCSTPRGVAVGIRPDDQRRPAVGPMCSTSRVVVVGFAARSQVPLLRLLLRPAASSIPTCSRPGAVANGASPVRRRTQAGRDWTCGESRSYLIVKETQVARGRHLQS